MSPTHCWFMLLYVCVVTYPCPQPNSLLVYVIICVSHCGFRLMLLLVILCNKFHYNVVNFSASQQSPCNSVKICEANICKVCCELRVWSARSFILTFLIFMQYIMCDIIIIIIMGISCIFILLITKLSLSACLEKPPVLKCIFTLPHLGQYILWWCPEISHNTNPDIKVHGANMGPTWVLSAPDGPHVSPMNLAIREYMLCL